MIARGIEQGMGFRNFSVEKRFLRRHQMTSQELKILLL